MNRAVSYELYWNNEADHLSFTDQEEALLKAHGLAEQGFEVYVAYIDQDGDEVFYEEFGGQAA